MKIFLKALTILGKNIPWLAKQLNVSHQTIYQWKLGTTKPHPRHIKKMSEILRIPMKDLLSDFHFFDDVK